MSEKRRGLGRGLGALIPSSAVGADEPEPVAGSSRRPVDLFFPVAPDGRHGADNGLSPRPHAINKEALRGQRKRSGGGAAPRPIPTGDSLSGTPDAGGPGDPDEGGQRNPVEDSVLDASVGASVDAGMDSAEVPTGPFAEHSTARDREFTAGANVAGSTGVDRVSRETLVEVPGARFAELPIDSIHANRKQPRTVFDEDEMDELVHSVKEIGVLQPIVVRPSSEGGDWPYELVMGERRWRAARKAGLLTVPAIIRSTSDDDLLRDALLENLHRSALNPLEEAAAYQQLLDDFGCSHDELAERIGRSRPQISNTLRLMKLPPLVQRRLAAGVLSAGHARALLGLADHAEMEKIAQRIVAEGLSVRAVEELVAMSDGLRRPTKAHTPRAGARHERLDYLANSLSDKLDTSVKITLGARKGRVSIEFATVDDLNRIMTVINPADPG